MGAIIVAVGFLAAFLLVRNRRGTLFIYLGAFAIILDWWLLIPAAHHRNWRQEVARLPYAEIHRDVLIIHNIRSFDYRTPIDFTPRHYSKAYNLNDLETLDFAKSHWHDLEDVAHIARADK